MRRFDGAEAAELLDVPGHDPDVLAENLADMGRANRLLGGVWAVTGAIEALVGGTPRNGRLAVLDIASGGAAIPRALGAWAARRGLRATIVASDMNPEIVRVAAAQEQVRAEGRKDGSQETGRQVPVFLAANGCHLPFSARSFDVVVCSLALHHLDPEPAIVLLNEMRRVARSGVILDDLVRRRMAYWGAWLFSRLASRNHLTRHDGPLSVRRAYTRVELGALCAGVGLGAPRFVRDLGYRVVFGFANTNIADSR
jgi:SAM-dependent methyltransferase